MPGGLGGIDHPGIKKTTASCAMEPMERLSWAGCPLQRRRGGGGGGTIARLDGSWDMSLGRLLLNLTLLLAGPKPAGEEPAGGVPDGSESSWMLEALCCWGGICMGDEGRVLARLDTWLAGADLVIGFSSFPWASAFPNTKLVSATLLTPGWRAMACPSASAPFLGTLHTHTHIKHQHTHNLCRLKSTGGVLPESQHCSRITCATCQTSSRLTLGSRTAHLLFRQTPNGDG